MFLWIQPCSRLICPKDSCGSLQPCVSRRVAGWVQLGVAGTIINDYGLDHSQPFPYSPGGRTSDFASRGLLLYSAVACWSELGPWWGWDWCPFLGIFFPSPNQIFAGNDILNSWVMFNRDIYQPLWLKYVEFTWIEGDGRCERDIKTTEKIALNWSTWGLFRLLW